MLVSKEKLFKFIIILAMFFSYPAYAQKDSLIMTNGDIIVGEMKGMDRGVITIETDYSKDDFRLEWKGLREVYTASYFVITLTNGTRLNGRLKSGDPGKVSIRIDEETAYVYDLTEVVYLKAIDKVFWDRLSAKIDLGFSLTKSQNLRQLTFNSSVGYLAERWSTGIYFNTLFSTQDEVEDIRRTDAGLSFNYFLPKDWYIPVSVSLLSNTEQKIDLRTLGKLGVGNYIIHTNHSYWGIAAGFSYNNEAYSDAEDRKSWEGYFGTELNLYDIGDLSLMTKAVVYPSFTESGRWRAEFVFDTKYDLPLDFYIKLGFNVDYDNRPVEGATETDYVLQTGFGWEW